MAQVLVIHHDSGFASSLVNEFEQAGLIPTHCKSTTTALGHILTEPPEVAVVEVGLEDGAGLRLCDTIRRDNAYAQVSLIALFHEGEFASGKDIEWDSAPFDDYLLEPVEVGELIQRIQLSLCRSRRNLDANPLTRLPGNNAIMRELDDRMARGEEFSVGYVDLDNFKAFNDKYGFARGDEALRMTGRLLLSMVANLGPGVGFIGHIGGDDFVFITPINKAASLAGQVVDHFDRLITSLYDESDREAGAIISTNRQGQMQMFPLMSISIAIVPNHRGRLKHLGQISAIAADLKKQAKQVDGSSVVIDRRKSIPKSLSNLDR